MNFKKKNVKSVKLKQTLIFPSFQNVRLMKLNTLEIQDTTLTLLELYFFRSMTFLIVLGFKVNGRMFSKKKIQSL